jgi:hypothetical protein
VFFSRHTKRQGRNSNPDTTQSRRAMKGETFAAGGETILCDSALSETRHGGKAAANLRA